MKRKLLKRSGFLYKCVLLHTTVMDQEGAVAEEEGKG